jgi:hypothetical protein
MVTFVIDPLWDIVVCDVSPLDYVDLLLGLPYQQDRNIVYHAKLHKYHLQHEGPTYVLTSSIAHSTQPLTGQAAIKQVTLNKYVSLCLVRSIKPDHLTNPTPQDMDPPLPEVVNAFPQPTRLASSWSIDHTIDLLLKASFLDAPSYHIAPQEADVIECQPDQILNSGPTPPSSLPCASLTFLMGKSIYVPIIFANRLCTPNQVPTYYNTLSDSSSLTKQSIKKDSGKWSSYKCSIAGKNHLHRHPFLVGEFNKTGGIGHTRCSSKELVFKRSVEVDNASLVD